MNRPIIPIESVRLSHSTIDLLHSCERKFQLEKLLYNEKGRDSSPDFVFGSAYGIAVAHYFIHQNREQALYELWMAYEPMLESEKKSLAKCLNALICSFERIDTMLVEYEVVSFKGKPAAELSFCLFTDSEYYYVGYMDIVLRSRFTDRCVVVDVKTTGLELTNLDPLYKNSNQVLGYSIVLDAITGETQAEYDVIYFVAQLGRGFSPSIQVLTYPKTVLSRLQWFLSLGLEIDRLERMKELNVYPKRGDSCLKYNKPCFYFGICDLHSIDIKAEKILDETEYDFYFNLQELIDNHVERLS